MKKVTILGASGLIGSHLCMHYARQGAKVIAVTRVPGLVTKYLSEFCEIRMGDETNLGQMADLIVDCSARPTNYGYAGTRHQYKQIGGAPSVLLSTTLLMKEDKQLAPWANTEFIMDSYAAEKKALTAGAHVLRLPQVSIEGHWLPQGLLIASERVSLEHTLIEMSHKLSMDVTIGERGESVRDYIKITDLPKYIEAALDHSISHVNTGTPKTIQDHIEHFSVNYLNVPSILDRISYYSDAEVNNHSVDVPYLPNVFS